MLQELQAQLRLKRYPQRIECFDISMIHGAHAVGSQVTFIGGEPDKAHYRHYRIRTIDPSSGGDDFGMMLEVLKRRFTRAKRDEEMPELVVVDGGKGQLAMALAAMREVGVEGIDVVGLAKMRVQSAPRSAEIERSEERVFLPGQSNPVTLRRNSNALFLCSGYATRRTASRLHTTKTPFKANPLLSLGSDSRHWRGTPARVVAHVRQYERG